MKRLLNNIAVCALVLAGSSAEAMPLGVRTMMHARAAVRQYAGDPMTHEADVAVDAGGGATVAVPQTWFEERGEALAVFGGDTGAYVQSTAANGRKVWECFVLGLDPEDAEDDFKITSFPINADGTPNLDGITISPPQARWNVEGATPVLKGRESLFGGAWQTVTDENKAQMRFFKVEVSLP